MRPRSSSARAPLHLRLASPLAGRYRLRWRCSYCCSCLVGPFELGNLLSWHLEFSVSAECQGKQRHECTQKSQTCHPPDVPDHRKTDDDRKEGADKAGGVVFRHFDGLVRTCSARLVLLCPFSSLPGPESVCSADVRCKSKIPRRRRRRRRPFERAAIPWIGGHAQLVASANRDDELHDLTDDPAQDNDGA